MEYARPAIASKARLIVTRPSGAFLKSKVATIASTIIPAYISAVLRKYTKISSERARQAKFSFAGFSMKDEANISACITNNVTKTSEYPTRTT